MRLQNQILIIRVFLNVFILSLLGPLCTEAAVKTGPEFQVNTMDFWDQVSSSVTGLSGGGFVVTWHFYNGLSDDDISGQLFDSTGNKVGSEFQVNTYTDGRQRSSSVTGLSGGGFVVTWQSYDPYKQDGFDYGVYGQLFNSTGNKAGSEFRVNTSIFKSERNPSVAALSEGGFVVTWESYQDSAAHVYYQLFDSSGQKIGLETQVNTYLPDIQWQPSVSGVYGGGFIVTWASLGQDGNLYGVYGQLFDSFGNKVGSEFQVNTYTDGSQEYPSATGLSGGGFVVTWHSYLQDGSDYSVYGQLFDSTGNKAGSEFRVNTYTNGRQQFPSVTGLSGGGFVVTWHSYLQGESRYDISGQLFDSTGNKVGSEFRVNTYTNSDQVYPSVTGLSGGGFVVTWESYEQDGWGYGIYGQLYEMKGNAMPWIPLLLLDEDKKLPAVGLWSASTDFGVLEFTVDEESTGITKITFNFSDFSCGGVPRSGGVTVTPGTAWPIIESQFTVEILLDPNFTMTISGTFDPTGRRASGTWEALSDGSTCSGTWNAVK